MANSGVFDERRKRLDGGFVGPTCALHEHNDPGDLSINKAGK